MRKIELKSDDFNLLSLVRETGVTHTPGEAVAFIKNGFVKLNGSVTIEDVSVDIREGAEVSI